VDESLPLFKKAFQLEPGWRTLTPRLPKSGLLPNDPKLIQRIVSEGTIGELPCENHKTSKPCFPGSIYNYGTMIHICTC